MNKNLCLALVVFLFSIGLLGLANAQTSNIYWFEQFSYYNVDQLQAAGWRIDQVPDGVSIDTGSLVMDGTKGGDALVRYYGEFPQGINDWKVECRAMLPSGQGHSSSGVNILTQNHSYGFSADGYYSNFAFYRDGKVALSFGSYQEKADEWMTFTMSKKDNTISMYFNGELKNTYNEPDKEASPAIRVDIISPWRGIAYYDYYLLAEPTAITPSLAPTEQSSSFPIVPVAIGGGITAAAIIGGVLYYFYVVAGANPAALPPDGAPPGTKPPDGGPPGTVTPGGGPAGPTTAPFTAPTTAPGTQPVTAPFTSPTTAPGTQPTTAPFTSPTTAPGTAPVTAPGTQPVTAPFATPTTAPGTAPVTAPFTAPTTAPGTQPVTAPFTSPTTAPGTQPTSATQMIPTTPPPPTISDAAAIIGNNFQTIWKGEEVLQTTITDFLENMGMNIADAQAVIQNLLSQGVITSPKPFYFAAA